MADLQKIIIEVGQARSLGKPVALATVVEVKGSSYRLPGARMLIVDGRWVAGSISGGCLEDDVVLRAIEVGRTNRPQTATYDTTSDDDIVFGVGLGCKGVITILIEPVRAESGPVDLIEHWLACLRQREAGTVATVVRVEDQANAVIGARVLSRRSADATDIADTELTSKVRAAIEELPSHGTRLRTIALARGSVDVFLERIEAPVALVVFGAGHDAMPVVRLAKELGWQVTLVDHRAAYATAARFPLADHLVCAAPEEALGRCAIDADSLVLVMTHNYLRDLKLLECLLQTPIRYLGLLGPRKRAEQLLAELTVRGIQLSPAQLLRLYSPVGFDLGAESPAEVALSILAEMQAVVAKHPGGSLRDKKSPIHSSQ